MRIEVCDICGKVITPMDYKNILELKIKDSNNKETDKYQLTVHERCIKKQIGIYDDRYNNIFNSINTLANKGGDNNGDESK